jgi:hypothetical protein
MSSPARSPSATRERVPIVHLFQVNYRLCHEPATAGLMTRWITAFNAANTRLYGFRIHREQLL